MTRRFLVRRFRFRYLHRVFPLGMSAYKPTFFDLSAVFSVENASICVVSGLWMAVLATGKAITARRMFGRVWIRYCTILEREESRSAAQTRASQYALSLTVTVIFLMGSPSGGTERFPGLPSIYDCPCMEGNYLQDLAARLVGKKERAFGVRGLPSLDFQTWETLEAGVGENKKRRLGE